MHTTAGASRGRSWQAMDTLWDGARGRAGSWTQDDNLDYKVTAFQCPDSKVYQKHKVKAKNIRSMWQSFWARSHFQELPSPPSNCQAYWGSQTHFFSFRPRTLGDSYGCWKKQSSSCACVAQLVPQQWRESTATQEGSGSGTPAWNTLWAYVWTKKWWCRTCCLLPDLSKALRDMLWTRWSSQEFPSTLNRKLPIDCCSHSLSLEGAKALIKVHSYCQTGNQD